MKAIVQRCYGSVDDLELREVEKPIPHEGEVLVHVRAASLHPDVWHVVTGRPWMVRLLGAGLTKPKVQIPGTDMAGIVEAVGQRVTRFRLGDSVFGETRHNHQWLNGGAFAEFVCVPEDLLALKPDSITFEQAASVPTSGYIALMNLRDRNRLGSGRKVLINGAGGGVGSLALQIAKAHGAHVTAVDGASKLRMLRSLGADDVIDFRREDFTERSMRYDLIFDVPGTRPFSDIRRVLQPDGRYVPIGHQGFQRSRRRVFGLIPHFMKLMFLARFVKQLRGPSNPFPTRTEAIMLLREFLEAGKITPVIDSTYGLGEVRDAFRRMTEEETLGKVILTPVEAF